MFENLVYNYAVLHGSEVLLATATSSADSNWTEYQAAGSRSGRVLSEADFTSGAAISGLQKSLTILEEERVIGGQASPTVSRTPIFARWFANQLLLNPVVISNAPGLTASMLPGDLPPVM